MLIHLPNPQTIVIAVLHHNNHMNVLYNFSVFDQYSVCGVQYITKRHNFASIISYVGPTHKSCTEITSIPTTSSTGSTSTINSHLTEHPPTDSSTEAPNGHSKEPLILPLTEFSTEAPNEMTAPVSTARPPCKVVGVHVTSNTGVQNNSPTLTVMWHALASGAVTYTVKYSTQPGR